MDAQAHVDALEREGRLLVGAARASDLSSVVPTCPRWRVADLLAHIGYVHRWATRYVATALTEAVDEPDETAILAGAPPEDERCDWVEEGHRALVSALREAQPGLACWTFLPAPSPLAMWARRQAHETTVHRVDAELAVSRSVTPVETAFAEDGIDELLLAFFGRDRPHRGLPAAPVSIGLEAVDGAGRWTVRLSESGVESRRESDGDAVVGGNGVGGDVVVRGTASDLYLLLWHRRTLEGLHVAGTAEIFDEVWGPRGVTWG